ncbi:hypothetical protein ACLOJK_029559 [Asimina triloba]
MGSHGAHEQLAHPNQPMQCSNPTAHRQMPKSFKSWPMSNRNYRATHPTIESRKPNPSHQQLTFISPFDRPWPADQHHRPAASGSASSGSPDHPASPILEWQAEISAHSLHQHHGSEIKRPNSKSRAPISNEQPCHSQIIQPQAASDGHIQSHDHAQIIQSAVHACPAPNPSHNRAANHGHLAGEPKTQTTPSRSRPAHRSNDHSAFFFHRKSDVHRTQQQANNHGGPPDQFRQWQITDPSNPRQIDGPLPLIFNAMAEKSGGLQGRPPSVMISSNPEPSRQLQQPSNPISGVPNQSNSYI